MAPKPEDVAETLRQLRRTPEHFRGAATALTEAQLRQPPGPGTWSVHEVLAHLRGCADVQGGWIASILRGETAIRYKSPRTGMSKTGYEQSEFAHLLRDFRRQRTDLIGALSTLGADGWSQSALFTGTMPGWTQTVHEVARGMVSHEQAHYAQALEAAGRLERP